MSFRIQPIDQYTAPEEDLAKLHEIWCLFDAEYRPDDPPMPWAQRLVEFRRHRPNRLQPKWLGVEDGKPVALAGAWIDFGRPDNNVFALVYVRPEARGKGYAKLLAQKIIEAAEAESRSVVVTDIAEGHPATSLIQAIGLKSVMKTRMSRLRVEDVDRDLMRDWIQRASERASEYEIVLYESPMPDDVAGKFADLTQIMNTAPMEDLEMEPFVMTKDEWQKREQAFVDAGETLLTYIAIHKPTGDYAGYTNVVYRSNQPHEAHQHDTGVDPKHRNKGLGRWIKAAMILEFTERFPDVEWIDTDNAGSNEPMLNINYAMGFKTLMGWEVYQGPLDLVRDWAQGS